MRWKRLAAAGAPFSVNEADGIITGYVVAEAGPFKTPGRGQFTLESLQRIVELMQDHALGVKCRLAHPTESDDGVGKFLGRVHNPRLIDGKVRGDLHLAESAKKSPSGDLYGYVLQRVAEDSSSLSSSLVLETDFVEPEDMEAPPIWMPSHIHATDIVDTGDAVGALLSPESRQDVYARGCQALDMLFGALPEEEIRQRLAAFVDRYCSSRCGAASGHGERVCSVAERKRRAARLLAV